MSTHYSTEFKQEAVRLAVESHQPVAQTARDLGVNPNTLYTWISKYHSAGTSAPKGAEGEPPHEELKRLRREVALLKEERDILKKAVAYFAKDHR